MVVAKKVDFRKPSWNLQEANKPQASRYVERGMSMDGGRGGKEQNSTSIDDKSQVDSENQSFV